MKQVSILACGGHAEHVLQRLDVFRTGRYGLNLSIDQYLITVRSDQSAYHSDGGIRQVDERRRNFSVLTCSVQGGCIPQ